MDHVRYGLIGMGAQGGTYAAMLTGGSLHGMQLPDPPAHCTLGAICDNDPEVEAVYREQYPQTAFFRDWQELVLSDHVDAVVTTVPHYLHPEIAIFCLEHGVPVLVEKPAGVDAKSVRLMNEAAAAHPDTAFGIMFNQRTNRLYQQIKELVSSGELGEIRRSSWIINSWWRPDSYYQQSDWRATWGGEGGGVLVNQAPHQLDLWQWICGIPQRVYAKILFGAHREIAVDNDVTLVTEYANGATGSFITSTHDPIGTDRLEIDLAKGKIVVEDSRKATIYRLKQSEQELNDSLSMRELSRLLRSNEAGSSLFTTEAIEHQDRWGLQHMTVLDDFAAHLVHGTELLAPGSDGINGVQLANAALLSAWLGEEVSLPVDEDLFLSELNKRIVEEGLYPTRPI